MRKGCFAVLMVFAVFALLALPAAAETLSTDKVILVTGSGESVTTPDKVTLTFGVESTNPDAQVAQRENTALMNKVVSSLKAAGIKDENIKTNQYSMYSYEINEYRTGKWPNGTTVYEVTNSVEAVSYDVSNAGKLIDVAVSAGANKVNSMVFGLSNEKQIVQRNAAVISAVKAARADADAVSSALGIAITGTGKISVDQSYIPVSYSKVSATEMSAGSAADNAVPTPIEAGSLKTTASVSIVYTY